MSSVHHGADRHHVRPERRRASAKSVIEAAKELVPVIDLADREAGPGRMLRERFGEAA